MDTMTTNRERTPVSPAQLKALTGRLNKNRIANRSQGGRTLSYLEAWDVRNAMIRIWGFGEWSEENVQSEVLRIETDVPNAKGDGTINWRITALCRVKVTVHQTGAVYTGVAVATQAGKDLGEVTDFAMKTADSDAFKRAAMNLGTQFGLSLYDNGSTDDVVKVCFAPTQLLGVARTEENLAQASAAVAAVPAMTKEQAEEAERLVARSLEMANERDNARTPEAERTAVAETPAPEEPAAEPVAAE